MPNIEAELIHVAVAVIVRNGRVLLSKRAEHVHQGGLWEFPGGKVEAGETSGAALLREIKEELGVNIKYSRPLINIKHQYADKSVLLETHLVTDFDGIDYVVNDEADVSEQSGLEGQQVAWVLFEQLAQYEFPAANKAIINALLLPDSYLITPDCEQPQVDDFISQFRDSIREQTLVQLRLPGWRQQPEALARLAVSLDMIARQNNTRLMLNSSLCLDNDARPRQPLLASGSGVHLTAFHLQQSSQFINYYRQHYPQKLLAASCHNEADIEQANKLQVDFIVLSAVQPTESHPEQQAMGWQQFKRLTALAKMPVYALGGMTLSDIEQAHVNGAQGISAIRSLWRFNTGK